MAAQATEVGTGARFAFGRNWRKFLPALTEERIRIAGLSLTEMLRTDELRGRTFLDVGSGSGLFSLAARRLGARVHSFDYDPISVACTEALRLRYFPGDPDWTVQEGSVLDVKYLASLGTFDIVYSWGVLHHTGDLWTALENCASVVREGGLLYVAIYNDQGRKSRLWRKVKGTYVRGFAGRNLVQGIFLPYWTCRTVLSSILQRKNVFADYQRHRGMSIFRDWQDWLGGFPYEVASVEKVFAYLHDRRFVLTNIRTTSGLGNNSFVFRREAPERDPRPGVL